MAFNSKPLNGDFSKTMARKKFGFKTINFAVLVFGLICGLFIGDWFKSNVLGPYSITECGFPELDTTTSSFGDLINAVDPDFHKQQEKKDMFVIVGIMTAQKYIDTRGVSAFRTWVNSINGKVMFFSSEGSRSKYGVPVVPLPGVDDSYPPQKKSFMMLKYMHDHFINNYEWFIRADDDVFIKGDKLETFLRSINSSKPQFIGQAGVGKEEELGLLSLTATENFCMGGPGMIFSRETLKRMAPHVGDCLANLYSTHEDVEIGRCVRKYAGIQCTWAYEMPHILYHNYKEDQGSFRKSLKSTEVDNAVSLHPVKEPVHLFRIQNYFQSKKIMNLRHKELLLQRDIHLVDELLGSQGLSSNVNKLALSPSLTKYRPQNSDDVIPWDFMTRVMFSYFNDNPKRGLEGSLSSAIDDVIKQIMQLVNKNARQRGRTLDFKEILYGYRRINPLYGADYILDLLLIYRKHKGRKMTVPVRRHAYVQQTFTEVEFHEEIPTYELKSNMGAKVLHLFRRFAVGEEKTKFDKHQERINFVLPLAGRLRIFERFMQNFEDICLQTGENVKLYVVLFKSGREQSEEMAYEKSVSLLHQYQKKYSEKKVEILQASGAFSRGRGLELGAAQCDSDALLFFVDVDIVMTKHVLSRIRLNTKQGSHVYFPIVFSQYDPKTVCLEQIHCVCHNQKCLINPQDFSEETGYWRKFGYGIAAMYRSDMLAVGGFDLSIQGWGKEDVDLYQKYLASNITIVRSVDVGMTHAFHEIFCDSHLEPAQLVMCDGSRAQSLGSQSFLSQTVFNTETLLNRYEKFILNVDS